MVIYMGGARIRVEARGVLSNSKARSARASCYHKGASRSTKEHLCSSPRLQLESVCGRVNPCISDTNIPLKVRHKWSQGARDCHIDCASNLPRHQWCSTHSLSNANAFSQRSHYLEPSNATPETWTQDWCRSHCRNASHSGGIQRSHCRGWGECSWLCSVLLESPPGALYPFVSENSWPGIQDDSILFVTIKSHTSLEVPVCPLDTF